MSLGYQVHIYHNPAVFNVSGGGHAGTLAAFTNESDAIEFCKQKDCQAASHRIVVTREHYEWLKRWLPEDARRFQDSHL